MPSDEGEPSSSDDDGDSDRQGLVDPDKKSTVGIGCRGPPLGGAV